MQNRNELDFIKVLEENKNNIYRICKIYAVSPSEPQDLFQEVVYQVWKSFSSFQGKSSVNTWIYKIALNVCYSSKLRQKNKSSNTVRLDSIQFLPAENIPDTYQGEKYLALQECISSLKEIDKSIVILHLEELPYKEISIILDLTENHIAVKMKRIRKKLLDCITPKIK